MNKNNSKASPRSQAGNAPRGGTKPATPPPPRLSQADIKKVEKWAAEKGATSIRKF